MGPRPPFNGDIKSASVAEGRLYIYGHGGLGVYCRDLSISALPPNSCERGKGSYYERLTIWKMGLTLIARRADNGLGALEKLGL